MTGDSGVVGRDGGDDDVAGAGEGDDVPLKPARMAGTGVAIATRNGGGGAKYPSSMSRPMTEPLFGVGGGLSAYDSLSPITPPVLREDQGIDGDGVSGAPSSAFV